MKHLSAFLLIVFAAVLCWGADEMWPPGPNFKTQSGDFGAFLLEHAHQFGARVRTTNDLPIISTRWRYSTNAFGVEIYLTGDYFPQIRDYLFVAFGPPAERSIDFATYKVRDIGARIELDRKERQERIRYTELRISRPIKPSPAQ